MRIITGKARGIRLETLDGLDTRPTSERTKEAVFSMLQFDIAGSEVLDLFAGSGQMGLEALSRGAKKATFCDSSRDAIDIVMRNAKKTRLFDKCRISACDYNQMIRGIAGKEKYDIIFIDPPYKDKIIAEILKKIIKADIMSENCIVICESGDEDVFYGDEELKSKYTVSKISKYSISYVTVLRNKVEME